MGAAMAGEGGRVQLSGPDCGGADHIDQKSDRTRSGPVEQYGELQEHPRNEHIRRPLLRLYAAGA